MDKQNCEVQERFSEDDQMKIAWLSFSMTVKKIAEEFNVTPGAIAYQIRQPNVQKLIEDIRQAKHEALVEKARECAIDLPQGEAQC